VREELTRQAMVREALARAETERLATEARAEAAHAEAMRAEKEAAASIDAETAARVEVERAARIEAARIEAEIDAGVRAEAAAAAGARTGAANRADPPVHGSAAVAVPADMPAQLLMQTEFLRLLEVVTNMCDHVIEYIESDRTERRTMIETMTQLGRVITEGAAAMMASAISAAPTVEPAPRAEPAPHAGRERIIGGSMDAGPEPVIDLREPERRFESVPERPQLAVAPEPGPEPATAVEVRGRFGDRWVDGFEICEVTTTHAGPRYRLRRHRDGAVLPELFDAASIRHVETFDQLSADQYGAERLNSAEEDDESNGERLRGVRMHAEVPDHDELNGSTGYWSRS